MTGKIELREHGGRVRAFVTIGNHPLQRGRSKATNDILDVVQCKLTALIETTIADVESMGRRASWEYVSACLNCDRLTAGNTELTIYSV